MATSNILFFIRNSFHELDGWVEKSTLPCHLRHLQTVQVNGTPERAFTEGGSNTEAISFPLVVAGPNPVESFAANID